ncbi:MAG: GAF domain-containing sensor histidine kinase [Anaerolineae bacterium]|nr:GAF domain-containing sensor histidine kinase [Anaerolineae bacterium]
MADHTSPTQYEQEIQSLRRMVDISLALNSTMDLRTLLKTITAHAAEITNSDTASIMLYEPDAKELHFIALTTSRYEKDLLKIPVPLEGSIAGIIHRENRVLVIDDVTQDPRHYRGTDAPSGFVTRSILGVPMRYKDEPIGVLEAVNKREGKWTADDERNIFVLAAQSAIAIKNAQMLEQLRAAYNELDQLDKLKNDFIAIASHELRTPLSVILGYATFLKEDAQGEVSAHASSVLNSALRMRNLIEDMTNLRYLKLGEAELKREHIPLAAIFQSAHNDVQDMVEAKGHTFTVEMPEMSLVVVVDRIKLGMAVTNLLLNATKFTPSGGQITLTYTIKPGAVWIVVQDTGVGIPPDQLERIFEEFHQVEDHMTRRHGGMGLGLSIARALVEAHGGRIWAESDGQGRGSTFIINLPTQPQQGYGTG